MREKSRAWIELNRKHLQNNVEQLKSLVPENCRLMPAVKADAYGHGMEQIARMLSDMGIQDFCVACADEGIRLRKAGIRGQILVLGYTYPGQFEDLAAYDLTQTVVDVHYARELQRYGKPCRVHVGIDTGMHRLGERCEEMEAILEICSYPALRVEGIFSHLCVSDSQKEEDREFTLEQVRKFDQVIDNLKRSGITGFATHLQASYGMLNYSWLKYDYCRPGIVLYGLYSSAGDDAYSSVRLLPVMELKVRIESVRMVYAGEGAGYGLAFRADRDTRIAALSAGYADGIPREITGRGYVLIRGKRAPVIGRICMDQMLVDVSAVPDAQPGDEAVLIGRSGQERITGEQFAGWCSTITNEVFSRLGSRLERIEIDEKP
ncbi:MAG: serine racemase VanT catalytic subunit [Lachnospiraceae bacterium]|nr:serine racemase VanT catalytic subunit [Lachnospiraceae bacterium]